MAYVNTGLANGGQTQYYKVQYDDSLSVERGLHLAQALMVQCDADFSWLQGFFPGVTLGTPITVKLPRAADADGGGSWGGWGPVPVEVTLGLGEAVVPGGDALAFLRYLLVVEVSEVFMRERQPAWFNRFNDWFEAFDEGSKGESLSLIIGVQFMRDRIPHAVSLPTTEGFTFGVADIWLNGARASRIDANPDDIQHDDITGCGALFLLFLHDQLGFGIGSIIAAGGGTLADVFSHLTGIDKSQAFSRFADLVNLHYPSVDGGYMTRMETAFPVPNLTMLLAPSQLSWVSNTGQYLLQVGFDALATVNTTVHLTSDNPGLVDVPPTLVVQPGNAAITTRLTVDRQPVGFATTKVTFTATYAGVTLQRTVEVSPPDELAVPDLQIEVVDNGDPCHVPFTEGSELKLGVRNIGVFSNRRGLVYDWAADGLRSNAAQLVIPMLPAAGTHVDVELEVHNLQGLRSRGHFEFDTVAQLSPVLELERQVRCRVQRMQQVNVQIPPWIPIEVGPLVEEQLAVVEQQAAVVAEQADELVTAVAELRAAQVAAGR